MSGENIKLMSQLNLYLMMELKVFEKNLIIDFDRSASLSLEDNSPSREELIWNANGGLTEKQIEQYLIVARSIGTFARALDCPTALKHPSLHMSAASASRDATLVKKTSRISFLIN